MIPSIQPERFQRNTERIIQLMQRSIDLFNQTSNAKLADQWKKILLNYKRAMAPKNKAQ